MEKAFERAPYPDVFAREDLALRIGLSEARIQVSIPREHLRMIILLNYNLYFNFVNLAINVVEYFNCDRYTPCPEKTTTVLYV